MKYRIVVNFNSGRMLVFEARKKEWHSRAISFVMSDSGISKVIPMYNIEFIDIEEIKE